MILVITGTAPYNFERLLKEMDTISDELDDEVVLQMGLTEYKPKNVTNYFAFTSEENMKELYNQANLIVCHAGVGTIINCIRLKKRFIIVPRVMKYAEHFDDHQLGTAKEFAKEGIHVIYDIKTLKQSILEYVDHFTLDGNNIHLVHELSKFLETLEDDIAN